MRWWLAFMLAGCGSTTTVRLGVHPDGGDLDVAPIEADAPEAALDVGAADAAADASSFDAAVDAVDPEADAPSPPCRSVAQNLVDNALTCARIHCEVDGAAVQDAGGCLANCCDAPFVAIEGASQACFDCLAPILESGASVDYARQRCD